MYEFHMFEPWDEEINGEKIITVKCVTKIVIEGDKGLQTI